MEDNKPYFVNKRYSWEFSWINRLLWFVFGDKLIETVEIEEGIKCKVIAYKMFNITYIHKVFLNNVELKGQDEV